MANKEDEGNFLNPNSLPNEVSHPFHFVYIIVSHLGIQSLSIGSSKLVVGNLWILMEDEEMPIFKAKKPKHSIF